MLREELLQAWGEDSYHWVMSIQESSIRATSTDSWILCAVTVTYRKVNCMSRMLKNNLLVAGPRPIINN